MKQPLFKGRGVAIVTPFCDDNTIDFDAFGRVIDIQIKAGTKGIIVLGTTGEAATISDNEFNLIVDFAVKRVNGRIKVVVGVGKNCTAKSVFLSRQAAFFKADALLVVTPYYNKTTQNGLIEHFKAIAAATDLPIMLYNVPSRTGVSFEAQTYRELSKLPSINGVKEASGNQGLVLKTRHLCPDDFYFYCGNDEETVSMMSMGAVGCVSVLGNIAPEKLKQMCDFALVSDFKSALKIQIEMFDLIEGLFCEVNPIPVKAALAKMGLMSENLRLPLIKMSEKNREKLFNSIKKHGLI